MQKPLRLDVYLTNNALASSRERAKSLIHKGLVYVDGRCVMKPSELIPQSANVQCGEDDMLYVGRGGLKLEAAIKAFGIELTGLVCMDVGASTGGFTDCMLKAGAKRVYAVDVGTDQLALSLRSDKRVINLQKTNFRYMKKTDIEENLDFSTVDVSFISLKLILPVLKEFFPDNGAAVVLIKPQFEAGRALVGKNGLVKSQRVHEQVVSDIKVFAQNIGFTVNGVITSPVRGGDGNTEFLMYMTVENRSEGI